MILKADNVLLYIHPSEEKSIKPLIDELTLKIAFAIENCKSTVIVEYDKINKKVFVRKNMRTNGYHTCKCGANSTNTDYEITDGLYINSLAAHYVAFHRKDVYVEDLNKIAKLNFVKDYIPEDWILNGK